jgi:phosphoribosylformimino-5-aminoimidazole carboxamide ribotide isomerase
MRVLPVIDLKDGSVVRGVAGRRDEYRPMVSRLCASCSPREVARAFREQLGLTDVYLADLDAIGGATPAFATFVELRAHGARLWVDAGVRDFADAEPLVEACVDQIIIGLETIAGLPALEDACRRIGPDRVVFSLDLKDRKPLTDPSSWRGSIDAWSIASQAVAVGVRRMIVLDVARVGMEDGIGTEDLCIRLGREFPHLELIAGGGVRGPSDLHELKRCGVSWALVASALHDGRIGREDLQEL